MADLRAPEQNRLLGRLADMLRMTEGQAAAPEFLPPQLNVMNLVRQLMLPSAETVEKMSYGDPLFRMPQQSRIPITTDKQYLADIAGMVPFTAPAARPSARAIQDLVREIQTTQPVGAVNLAPTPSVPRSDIGFYSQLEAAVQPLQNKGTGQQYLAQIQKSAGVKPEEIQWTGLDTFLRGKQSVTKADIQDYLNANRVDVREVRLGRPETINTQSKYATPEVMRIVTQNAGMADNATLLALDNDYAAYKEITTRFPELGDNPDWAEVVLNDVTGTFGNLPNLPKYANWQLPGGENYREILLTLPAKNPEFDPADLSRLTELSNKTRTDAETAEYRALASRYDASLRGETTPEYRSSHFDQPNILAHMRVNDRVVDGKKTLFIEEIQSDWHQAGRKKGYQRGKDLTPEQIDLKFIESKIPPGADPSVYPGYYEAFDKNTGQFLGRHSGFLNREQAMRDAIMSANQFQTGVPNAPFKTSWHELTLKRAIQEASEKGYDKIAFTTGKTQAERYDLSKQVNKIDVEAVEEVPNLYFVDVDVAGGKTLNLEVENGIVRNDEFAGKALEDVVGKEIAEKVMTVQQGKTQRLSGDDLRIGGEGMKGFYDNILPKSLEKLGKKFDAKVGKTEMDGVEVWQMDITPQMRESVTTKGQPLFAIPAIGTGLLGAGMMQEDEQF